MVQMSGTAARNKLQRSANENIPLSTSNDIQDQKELSPTGIDTAVITENASSVSWKCNLCSDIFSEEAKLATHSFVHKREYPSECRLCYSRFINDAELGYHINVHHFKAVKCNNNNSKEKGLSQFNNNSPSEIKSLSTGPDSLDKETVFKQTAIITNTTSRLLGNKVKRINVKHSKPSVQIPTAGAFPTKNDISVASSINSMTNITCHICQLSFFEYESWREHSVYKHIIAKNPYPIVEMNYIDPKTLVKSERGTYVLKVSEPSASNSQAAKPANEDLKITLCRESKEGYSIVKRSSVSDELDFINSTDESKHCKQLITLNNGNDDRICIKIANFGGNVVVTNSTKEVTNSKRKRKAPKCSCDELTPCKQEPTKFIPNKKVANPVPVDPVKIEPCFVDSPVGQKQSDITNEPTYAANDTEHGEEPSILKKSLLGSSSTSPSPQNCLGNEGVSSHEPDKPTYTENSPIPEKTVDSDKSEPEHLDPDAKELVSEEVLYIGSYSDSDSAIPKVDKPRMVITKKSKLGGSEEENIGETSEAPAEHIVINSPVVTDSAVIRPTDSEDPELSSTTIVEPGGNAESLEIVKSDSGNCGYSEAGEEDSPETILPLTQEDLEETMISQETQKSTEHFEAEAPPVNETKNIGVLPKKKQIITALRIEKELKEKEGKDSTEQQESTDQTEMSPTQVTPSDSPGVIRPNSTISVSRYEAITPTHKASAVQEADEVDLVIHIPEPEEITPSSEESVSDGANTKGLESISSKRKDSVSKREQTATDNEDQDNDSSGEADDRKCRICGGIFSTEDELLIHFERTHIRIGSNVSSRIFEPQSPYPVQSEQQSSSIFEQRRSFEDERPTRNIIVQPQNLARRNSSEIQRNVIHGPNTAVNHSPSHVRATGSVPLSFQAQLQQQAIRHQSTLREAQNNSVNLLTTGLQLRPQLSAVNYSNANGYSSRQPLQQHQPARSTITIPNGHSSQVGRDSQRNGSQLQLHHHQMIRQHQQTNNTPTNLVVQRSVNTGSSGSIPGRPVPVVRHNSSDQDGLRIIGVSSVGRTIPASESITQSQLNQQHHHQMLAQQLRNSGQSGARLIHQDAPIGGRSVINERTIVSNSNLTIRSKEGPAQAQSMFHHKRTAFPDASENHPAKQARLENLNLRPGNQIVMHQGPQGSVGRQVFSVDPGSGASQRPSPPSSITIGPVERVVNPARSTSNVANMRLGNAITVSVCPNDIDEQSSVITTRVPYNEHSPSSGPLNSNSVASALAIRGVTVTPASPDHVAHRSPVTVSIASDNIVTPVTHSVSPARTFGSPESGTALAHPGSQQFAIPRGPAPRVVCTSINPNIDRPHRPPTVDLTDEGVSQYVNRMHAAQYSRAQGQSASMNPMNNNQPRAVVRQPVSCNLCGVLFASMQALEEHKSSRHGISQRSGPANAPQPPLRTSQPSQPGGGQVITSRQPSSQPATPPSQVQTQIRTASPTRPAQNSNNSRFLYIPLLDISRLDSSRLRRLEDLGILSLVPLHGNERTGGHMGIPILSLRPEGLNNQNHMPWDSVLPVGPVHSTSNLAGNINPGNSGNTNSRENRDGPTNITVHHHQRQ